MNRTEWITVIASTSLIGVLIFAVQATRAQRKVTSVETQRKVAVPVSRSKGTEQVSKNPLPPEMKATIEADFARARVKTNEARLLFEQGKMREAEAVCQESFDLAPRFNNTPYAPDQKQLMGEINYAEGKYKEALYWFGDRANTRDDRQSFDIALCYVRMGDYGNAKRHYSHDLVYRYSSSTTAADLPVVHNLRSLEAAILLAQALDYDVSGEKKKASDGYDAAARLEPTNMWLHAKRGWIAIRAGRQEDGLALMRKAALSSNPSIISDVKGWVDKKEVAELRKASGIVDKPTTPAD